VHGALAFDQIRPADAIVIATEHEMSTVQGINGNTSFATAQNLDGLFTIHPDPNVQFDPAIVPHVSVVAVAEGGFDYYRFSLSTIGSVFFDIDNGYGPSESLNSYIKLYDANLQLVPFGFADNQFLADIGSTSAFDPTMNLTLSPGTYYLEVGVSPDFSPLVPGQDYTLHISTSHANSLPTITSDGGQDTAAVSVAENVTLVTTLTATDPNLLQTLSWSITGGEDQALFQIVNDDQLSFLTAPDFENLPSPGATPGYQVTVQVHDDVGGFDTQEITVTVTNVGGGTGGGGTGAGGNGGQTLTGTGEEDNLDGGNGSDILNGDGGNDTMTGGKGPDTFVFGLNFGEDVITDFKPHTDTIEIHDALFANFADLQAHAVNDGSGNTVITYDAANTITLLGVTVAELNANDFSFI
jgi:Ca2+-binding RTX toxin-like protein